MNDPYAGDIIDIYGTPIQLSTIKEYRLRQIEFILRPLYAERSIKARGIFAKSGKVVIEFVKMDYYAAVIGETKYKNAIEEHQPKSFVEALGKVTVEAVQGIAEAVVGGGQHKRIRYRLLNAAGRCFVRSYDDIPAVLARADGKRSDVFRKDELYPLLGEPIAPVIEMVPALEVITTSGPYIFFGNGIQLVNVENEYLRLRVAFESERQARIDRDKTQPNFLANLFGRILPQAQPQAKPDGIVTVKTPELKSQLKLDSTENSTGE